MIQNLQITQTDTTTSPSTTLNTYITLDPTQNQTSIYTVSKQGSGSAVTSPVTTYTGMTNGSIYDDSDIGHQETAGDPHYDAYTDSVAAASAGSASHGLDKTGGVSGVIADNYYNSSGVLVHASGLTVATPSTNNINIDGNITTNTQRTASGSGYITEGSDTNFLHKAGTIGLIGNAIEVVDTDSSGNPLTNVTVDAALMAYDTFDGCNIGGRATGTIQVIGSNTAETGGTFGVANGSGVLQSGLFASYFTDNRMASNPPPYFPTTQTGYDIISWQRVNSTLE